MDSNLALTAVLSLIRLNIDVGKIESKLDLDDFIDNLIDTTVACAATKMDVDEEHVRRYFSSEIDRMRDIARTAERWLPSEAVN